MPGSRINPGLVSGTPSAYSSSVSPLQGRATVAELGSTAAESCLFFYPEGVGESSPRLRSYPGDFGEASHLPVPSPGTGGLAVGGFENACQVTLVGEAGVDGDVGDRALRRRQLLRRPFET